jgi:hypothetical protein
MPDNTTQVDHPERRARRRLTRAGINAGIAAIVERVHPLPREADCLTVGEMERDLSVFCDETARLAAVKAWRDALLSVQAGGNVDVLLAEADRLYGNALTMFDDDEPAP